MSVPPGSTVAVGNTLGMVGDYTFDEAACGVTELSSGADSVLELTPTITGTMRLRAGWDGATPICASPANPMCWYRVIHVRSPSCSSLTDQIACGGPNLPDGTQDFSFPVTAGTPYYVIVDSYDDSVPGFSGPYYLEIDLTP